MTPVAGTKYQFPDKTTIEKRLKEDNFISKDYHIQTGITEKVTSLAAEIFANKIKTETEINKEARLVVQNTKESLPEVYLHSSNWTLLEIKITARLKSYAEELSYTPFET